MNSKQETKDLEQRIAAAEGKEKYYSDQMKILQREQAQLDRKKRNHRLFTRGAMLESFMRKPLLLTDDQVFQLLKTAFSSLEVKDEETAFIQEAIHESTQKASGEKADSE